MAPRELGDPAVALLDGFRNEAGQRRGDVRRRFRGVVAEPDGVAVVAGQRIAVRAVAAVLQAWQHVR
jgi:hypothetical protein